MVRIKDILLRPLGLKRNAKMWIIFIVNILVALGLIGTKIGINIMNFNSKILGVEWGIILGIILLWIAIWAKFEGI